MSILATALLVAGALPGSPAPHASAATAPIVIGHSVEGRPIRALRVGSGRAPVKVLVVGSVHGNEPAGKAVIARLRHARPPRGTALWLIEDANPDGAAANQRWNAHGVDLNRNFPYRWQPQDGIYESGPGAASEPETQAIERFVERVRPRVTIWYHQALTIVVKNGGDAKLQRLYSRLSGLPRKQLPAYHGTAVSWQNSTFKGDTAFVVELPGGPLSQAGVARHARAALALARAVAPPRLVWRPIPYGAERKADMRAYAQRHYGVDDYRLRRPRVIVEHYTVTDTFQSVFDTFAPNVPDQELHELPGICSHFVVDRDGTIYQLVRTTIMCRHTVGLNYIAIGIEHVGPQRRPGARQPAPDGRVAATHAHAAGQVRDHDAQRHRPQREPVEPVPPRAGRAPAHADPRRLPEAGDGRVPAPARAAARAGQPALTTLTRFG